MGFAFLGNLIKCPWRCAPVLFLASCLAIACAPGKSDSQPVSESRSQTAESHNAGFMVLPTAAPTPARVSVPTPTSEYDAAYAQGIDEAKKEIAEGYVTTYYLGPPRAFNYDPEVGLPFKGLDCYINPETQGRTDGHNDYIKRYIAAGGMPKNSTLKWQEQILHPYNYFGQPDVQKVEVDFIASLQTGVDLGIYKLTLLGTACSSRFEIARQDTNSRVALWICPNFDHAAFASGPQSSNLLYMLATYPPGDNYPGQTRILVWETVRGALLNDKQVPDLSQSYSRPSELTLEGSVPKVNRKDREPVD